MKVAWTEQAFECLKEILGYIGADSPEAASAFLEKIINRGEKVSQFPKSGRKVPEINLEDIREVIEGNYRIVYRIKKNVIEILVVFESHRQLREGEVKGE